MGKFNLSKKDKNYIFAILMLGIALVVSAVFNIIAVTMFDNTIKCLYQVGDDFTFNINSIGAYCQSFALSGNSLPSDRVKQKLVIVLPNENFDNVVLRAKVNLQDSSLVLSGFDDWILSLEDNYYYYSGEMYPNQNIGLCTEIKWENLELKSNTIYFVDVVVEFLYQDNIL